MVFKDLVPSLERSYSLLKKAIYSEVTVITGPPSTGKTTLAKEVFREHPYNDIFIAAYIDCYSISTPAKLFSSICRAFQSSLDITKAKAKKYALKLPGPDDLVNLSDFPRLLNIYYTVAIDQGIEALYLIVDHLEVFDRTNLMDSVVALCRASTQSFRNLRLVVITYEDPSDLVHYITQKSPAIGLSFQDRMQVVSCNCWSRQDTVNWILRLKPKREEELYRKFVKHIVSLVYTSDSRDTRQIRMYCQQNFAEFVDFHMEECKKQIRRKLKLEPDAEIPLQDLEDFAISDIFSTTIAQQFLNSRCYMIDRKRKNIKWTSEDTEMQMPGNTQILIVAAYIAAYTKSTSDKVNFVSLQKKKRISRPSRDKDYSNRPFTMERLIQIYLALAKSCYGERNLGLLRNNDCVLADIEKLENLNILSHQGGYELSSDSRYKLSTNIKHDYIRRLAKQMEIDLDCYHGLQPE